MSADRAYAVAQAVNRVLAVPLTPEQSRGIVVQVDRSAAEGGPGWPEFEAWLDAFGQFAPRIDGPPRYGGMVRLELGFRVAVAGGHTDVAVFAGRTEASRGKCGDLTFRNEEWETIARRVHLMTADGVIFTTIRVVT